jgi:hypothetical protein
VTYGPRPTPHLVPGSDASAEVSKKRKVDSSVKIVAKWPKALEKKKAEPAKTSVPPGKTGLKRPSNTDVVLAKSMKLGQKTVPHAINSVTAARSTFGASGPKRT